MQLGINLLFLSTNTVSCAGKYIDFLLEGFANLGLLSHCTLFIQKSYYEYLYQKFPEATIMVIDPDIPCERWLSSSKNTAKSRTYRRLNKKLASMSILKYEIDVMLFPYYDLSIHYIKGIPNYIVIQDLSDVPSDAHSRFLPDAYVLRRHRNLLMQADSIIVPSHTICQQLIQLFPSCQEEKLRVISLPIRPARIFSEGPLVEDPYILADISHAKTQQCIALLKAFQLIQKRIPYQLILIKQSALDFSELKEYIREHGLADRILCLSKLTMPNQNSLISHASLAINSSLSSYSSQFCIEAALLRIPVLSAYTAVLFELTKGLLNYYDFTMDTHELAIRILQLLQSHPTRAALEKIASTYTMLYDPGNIASHYAEMLR